MPVKTFTDDNFASEVLQAEAPVAVDFWAPWCFPCQMQGPIIEELAEEIGKRAILGKLNIEENPEVTERYGIMSIPTIIIFQNGEIVHELHEFRTKKRSKRELKS